MNTAPSSHSADTRAQSHNPVPAPTSGSRDAEDLRLLERVGRGDKQAFETLYQIYAPRLGGFIWRMLRRSELVDEAVNDVMMVVWQKAATFEPYGKVSTWMFGIAHRKALSLLDKERRHVKDRVDEGSEGRAAQLPAADSSVENVVEARMELDDLRSRIQGLSEEHRAVVELTFFSGLSYPEVAKALDCPVNTVKTRMFHARKIILQGAS
ncbi:MAG: RNA polymerase sigma factor [Myxococcota bacterium]